MNEMQKCQKCGGTPRMIKKKSPPGGLFTTRYYVVCSSCGYKDGYPTPFYKNAVKWWNELR